MEGLWERVGVVGPLLPHVRGYAEDLTRRGYADRSVDEAVRRVSHLSRWLSEQGLLTADLTPQLIDDFRHARRQAGWRTRSMRAFVPLLTYLSGINVIQVPGPKVPATTDERLLDTYRKYLVQERGLVDSTVGKYARMAAEFLRKRSQDGAVDLTNLTPTDIVEEVLVECRRRRPGAAMRWVTELRSWLRFLEVDGRLPNRLTDAVPYVPRWRDAALPQALKPGEVARLLDACDRGGVAGRRDYAVITLLARLGLRAREVANLRLDDIDWRHGEITVQAKGRCEQLPLPSDVGEALHACLRDRPAIASRHVFLTVLAPTLGMGASGIGCVVRRVSERAGMGPFGAHRLRHTAATEMLREGASLAEIGQVLRHQDVQTTAIYAKVDYEKLRVLTRLWPGGGR